MNFEDQILIVNSELQLEKTKKTFWKYFNFRTCIERAISQELREAIEISVSDSELPPSGQSNQSNKYFSQQTFPPEFLKQHLHLSMYYNGKIILLLFHMFHIHIFGSR